MRGEWETLSLRGAGVSLIDCDHRTPPAVTSGYPYVAIPQLKAGRLDLSDARQISDEHYIEWTRKAKPRHNDVILSRRCNPGETAYVPAGLECALGQNLVLLRSAGTKVDPPFLRWLVRSPQWWEQVGNFINVGAVFDSLKCADIPNFVLTIPPFVEQKAITAVLGALENKIELNRRMNETLEAIARALFQSWFVDFDPVCAKAEDREPPGLASDVADLFPTAFEESALGLIPQGWGVGTLGDVADNFREGVDPSEIDREVAYIGLEHMPRKSIALDEWETADDLVSGKFVFSTGDILFGKLRPYFHKVGVAPVDGVCSTDILVIRPKRASFHAFVLGHVSSESFVNYADAASTGTKMPRTNWRDMANYKVALPPDNILSRFNELVAPMVQRIRANIHQSRTLAELRDTLLPKLLSGEVRVKG